jgi:cation-transporting ATPase F
MAAVRKCQSAGIAVKMITGDHVATAKAIAQQMGLQSGPNAQRPLVAVTGQELAQLSGNEWGDVAERATVFARVAPEQKLRLVEALKPAAISWR